MAKKIKVGVFGADRGRQMIDFLSDHPDAETVAVCDANISALHRCRENDREERLTYYTDVDRFFEHDFDAVVLANFANEHAPYAVRALESGRHVLSEVLAVQTLSEAVQLIEAVDRSGCVYAYGENYCYFKSTFEMKKLFAEGAVGPFVHGEGEYVHKTVSIWPDLTHGDRNHWRNRMYSTYYCTHSIGPLLTITGSRPVRVVGFESPNVSGPICGMRMGGSAVEICQMDNGATMKSLHSSCVASTTSGIYHAVYGPNGMMESDRWGPHVWNGVHLRLEHEGENDEFRTYQPEFPYQPEPSPRALSHGGADVAMVYFFVDKILGRPQGEHCIDVHTGVDMSIVGILAYKSILSGNQPLDVPDFRVPENRERYQNDTFGFDPELCRDDLAPSCSFDVPEISDEVYQRMRDQYEAQSLE